MTDPIHIRDYDWKVVCPSCQHEFDPDAVKVETERFGDQREYRWVVPGLGWFKNEKMMERVVKLLQINHGKKV